MKRMLVPILILGLLLTPLVVGAASGVSFISTTQTITQEIVAPPPSGGDGFVPPKDETPPRIYDVSIRGITRTTANIYWSTNEKSTSQVRYWTGPYILSSLGKTYTTRHRVHLTDLTPGTTYYYRTMSRDEAGNLRVSSRYSFTTLEEETVVPPVEPEPVEPEPTPPEPAEPVEPFKPVEPKQEVPWGLIIGLIAGLVLLGGVGYWLTKRKKGQSVGGKKSTKRKEGEK